MAREEESHLGGQPGRLLGDERLDRLLCGGGRWIQELAVAGKAEHTRARCSPGERDLPAAGSLNFAKYDELVQAAVEGKGVALGRMPLLRRMLREKKLVTPFRKSVVSSRGYYLLRSPRAAGRPEVVEFEAWLLAETGREAKRL